MTSKRPAEPPEPSEEELREIFGNLEFFLDMEEATALPLEEEVAVTEEVDRE